MYFIWCVEIRLNTRKSNLFKRINKFMKERKKALKMKNNEYSLLVDIFGCILGMILDILNYFGLFVVNVLVYWLFDIIPIKFFMPNNIPEYTKYIIYICVVIILTLLFSHFLNKHKSWFQNCHKELVERVEKRYVIVVSRILSIIFFLVFVYLFTTYTYKCFEKVSSSNDNFNVFFVKNLVALFTITSNVGVNSTLEAFKAKLVAKYKESETTINDFYYDIKLFINSIFLSFSLVAFFKNFYLVTMPFFFLMGIGNLFESTIEASRGGVPEKKEDQEKSQDHKCQEEHKQQETTEDALKEKKKKKNPKHKTKK